MQSQYNGFSLGAHTSFLCGQNSNKKNKVIQSRSAWCISLRQFILQFLFSHFTNFSGVTSTALNCTTKTIQKHHKSYYQLCTNCVQAAISKIRLSEQQHPLPCNLFSEILIERLLNVKWKLGEQISMRFLLSFRLKSS